VLLEEGEANLPKRSVVNVSQLYTLDKSELVEKIGSLPRHRIEDVLAGIYLLLEPREVEG
jgi:mRNA interferase MazF